MLMAAILAILLVALIAATANAQQARTLR
jgi:hypothetical protein